MINSELNKLHSLQIMLMEEIKRICDLNCIKYSLTGGSLIGAIRHKGFIPWDDDMDVAMLREDYNIFLVACKTQLDPKFEIQTMDSDENYFYGFAKILLKDTHLVQYCHEKTKQKKGIYVDIFPLDTVPEDEKKKKKHKITNYLLIKMLSRKGRVEVEDKYSLKKHIAFHAIDVLNIFFSMPYLKRKLQENMTRYSNEKSCYVCNLCGYYGYDKETTYKAYFEKTINLPFENTEFAVIERYDDFLKHIYGDYMQLPPENKRHTHGFKNIEFGPYK